MIAEYSHSEGFIFRVFYSEHMDFGMEISNPAGDVEYSSPHGFSHESYGLKPHKRYRYLDDAIYAESKGAEDAFVPWDEKDWESCLKKEADMLLSVFCPEGSRNETTKDDKRYSQWASDDGKDIWRYF